MVNLEVVWRHLESVRDPRTRVSVVELGLVYAIAEPSPGELVIQMMTPSLEEPMMRMFSEFEQAAAPHLLNLLSSKPGIRAARVDRVENPRWSPDRLRGSARAALGPFFAQESESTLH